MGRAVFARWRAAAAVLMGALAGSLALSGALAQDDGSLADAALLGGDTTVVDDSVNAFSLPAANLSIDRQTAFFIGNSFFKRNWVEAPASTTGRDGLGPNFIARSCGACHLLDGRGAPPPAPRGVSTEAPVALLLRLSVPGDGAQDGARAEPTYGLQLNTAAVGGVKPEATVRIRYREIAGRFADGEPYSLRAPRIELNHLAYGPLAKDLLMSPRIAPQVIGLGLLEAIREADLLVNAAEQQRGGEVSGRVNRVWDVYAQAWVVGRFGWKANVGSVAHQTAAAFVGDIGITSQRFAHEECMPAQTDCRARQATEAQWRAQRGEPPVDIDERTLERTIFYTRTLAVPARRNVDDPRVRRGERLFRDAGCASCHRESYVTGELPGMPELSNQRIRPYTDLLLHDMGAGLADGRPDFQADGREWRTPPLWGIGLVKTVNGHTFFLHDGRARNLMEAVLWHGGESEASQRRVLRMSKADRAALILFLESL